MIVALVSCSVRAVQSICSRTCMERRRRATKLQRDGRERCVDEAAGSGEQDAVGQERSASAHCSGGLQGTSGGLQGTTVYKRPEGSGAESRADLAGGNEFAVGQKVEALYHDGHWYLCEGQADMLMQCHCHCRMAARSTPHFLVWLTKWNTTHR